MTFFEYIRSIYTKQKNITEIDNTLCITLSKWLSYDISNLPHIKSILQYFFWIEPIHYYYLLWFNIPYKSKAPFLNNIKKLEEKANPLYNKIAHILDWSERELNIHKNVLDKVIDSKYWKEEFGI